MARRRRRHAGGNHTDPDLPITPMLDMSFQLMAFFILTFRPTPMEAMLPLVLPADKGDKTQQAPPAFDPLKEEEEELKIQIYAADSGAPNRIIAKSTAGEDTEIGSDTGALNKYLRDQLASRGGKAPKLILEMVENLNYQYVIKLLDESRRAGYDQITPQLIGG